MNAGDLRVVLCTAPAAGEAGKPGAAALAAQLVQERLCACANVLPAVQSFFWWEGKVDTAHECLLVLKTAAVRCAELRARIVALHPYTLPEILELQPSGGLEAYLQWVGASVAPAR